MSDWKPTETPFRVSHFYQTSRHPGWGARTATYATYEEAMEIADKPLGAGITKHTVDFALNAETWMKNGNWQPLFSRERGKVRKFKNGAKEVVKA